MSARCQHPNVTIGQLGTYWQFHRRRDDGTWDMDSEPYGFTDRLHVTCPDCGLDRRYTRVYPKWLQVLLDEAQQDTSMPTGVLYGLRA
jgi:hypothetical protein